ncbi:MAG: AAA family ATPase [Planctomycetota bacterium]|jgi:chromosome partitioning protein
MRTIAVVNQKGGCGKTTVSINLSAALAEMGHKTLLIDMDPQSHCAVGLAVPEEQIEQSIYDVLISKSRNEPLRLTEVLWQISDNLELAPASIDLAAFEQQMAGVVDRESCLWNVVNTVDKDYDYAVIDCPPAVSLLTFNALRAATDVIVPVETGYFSLHGLSKQLETLNILSQRCGQLINVRVLASMYDVRTKLAREVLSELKSHFDDKMFRNIVNFNTKIKEAASFGQPIVEYDPASKGYLDFKLLAEEIISAEEKIHRRQIVNSLANQLDEISISADELLESVTPLAPVEVEQEQPQVETPQPQALPTQEKPEPKLQKTNEKLSDYYGVNQIKEAIVFVSLYPRANEVQIAGDFNNWQPEISPLQKVGQSGIWQTKLKLSPGKHRYRLVVDGQWQQDPYNEKTELNPFGEYNSVVEVR